MSPEALAHLACSVAAFHRLGMLGQGGAELARLVDELGTHLCERPLALAVLAPIVSEIVAAQERGDPIGLADALEHELAARLVESSAEKR